jgi:CRISPR-associated protein Cas2
MSQRALFVAAYDVADPSRLRAALRVLRHYATGGQKSVFECFLTPSEKASLLAEVQEVIDLSEDRFLLIRLDPRSSVETLGIAVKPVDPDFYYVG